MVLQYFGSDIQVFSINRSPTTFVIATLILMLVLRILTLLLEHADALFKFIVPRQLTRPKPQDPVDDSRGKSGSYSHYVLRANPITSCGTCACSAGVTGRAWISSDYTRLVRSCAHRRNEPTVRNWCVKASHRAHATCTCLPAIRWYCTDCVFWPQSGLWYLVPSLSGVCAVCGARLSYPDVSRAEWSTVWLSVNGVI